MLGSCEACTVYALIGGSRADGVTDTVHAGVEGKCGWDKNLLKKVKLRWRRTVLSELRKLEDWGMLCQPLWFVFSDLSGFSFSSVLCTISTPFDRCTSLYLFSDACYERLLQLVLAGGEFLAPMHGLYLLQEYIDQPLTSSPMLRNVQAQMVWRGGRMSYVSGLQNRFYNLILMLL